MDTFEVWVGETWTVKTTLRNKDGTPMTDPASVEVRVGSTTRNLIKSIKGGEGDADLSINGAEVTWNIAANDARQLLFENERVYIFEMVGISATDGTTIEDRFLLNTRWSLKAKNP